MIPILLERLFDARAKGKVEALLRIAPDLDNQQRAGITQGRVSLIVDNFSAAFPERPAVPTPAMFAKLRASRRTFLEDRGDVQRRSEETSCDGRL